jgi:hypothetical protein
VRKPRKRVPVRGMKCHEHPAYGLKSNVLDIWIFIYIVIVVPVDKIILEGREVNKYCNESNKQGNDEEVFTFSHTLRPYYGD